MPSRSKTQTNNSRITTTDSAIDSNIAPRIQCQRRTCGHQIAISGTIKCNRIHQGNITTATCAGIGGDADITRIHRV